MNGKMLPNISINKKNAETILPLAIFIIAWTLIFLSPLRYMWNMSNQLSRTLSALAFENSLFDPFFSFGLPEGLPLFSLMDYVAMSTLKNIEAGRLISFTFGFGTLFVIYKTALLWFDKKTARYSMLLLALSPLFLLNSMAIKRETMLLFFSSMAFLLLSKYKIQEKQIYLILTGLFLTLGSLAKPVGVFMFIGVCLYLIYERKFNLIKEPGFYIGIILPVLMFFLLFVHPYLTKGGLNYGKNNITWHLITYLDVSFLELIKNTATEFIVLLPLPLLILAFNGFSKLNGLGKMAIFWLFSGTLFYLVFLSGAYHHTHYASMMLPALAIIGGRGMKPTEKKLRKFLGENKKHISKTLVPAILIIILASASFCYADFIKPNVRYQRDMGNTGEVLRNELNDLQSIGLTQNTQSVFFHIFSENSENTNFLTDKEIVRLRKKPLEELENLENKPDILIVQIKPFKFPSGYEPQGEKSEWGEYPRIPEKDLEIILNELPYENYKKLEYFLIIKKSKSL
ncbi:MAG: ArnT family glycosyltransferase [Candidatus Hadarchaeia archaeon]